MWFLILGVALLAMKMADINPVVALSWWWIVAPFGLAVVWWGWADATGYTKRKEMEKMETKRAHRRRKTLENLGMDERGRRHSHDKR